MFGPTKSGKVCIILTNNAISANQNTAYFVNHRQHTHAIFVVMYFPTFVSASVILQALCRYVKPHSFASPPTSSAHSWKSFSRAISRAVCPPLFFTCAMSGLVRRKHFMHSVLLRMAHRCRHVFPSRVCRPRLSLYRCIGRCKIWLYILLCCVCDAVYSNDRKLKWYELFLQSKATVVIFFTEMSFQSFW